MGQITTRSTDEVLARLSKEQQAVVEQIGAEMQGMENPPPSAGHCYLMEQAGWVWNQRTRVYEGVND